MKKWLLSRLFGNDWWYTPRTSTHAFMLLQHWKNVDLMRAFQKMIWKKTSKMEEQCTLLGEVLIESIDSKEPFQHIYYDNALYFHPEHTLIEHEYVKTPSENDATKLWKICNDWETWMTKEQLTKAAALNLTVHWLPYCKLSPPMWAWYFVRKYSAPKHRLDKSSN